MGRTTRHHHWVRLLAVPLTIVVVTTGCGGDDEDSAATDVGEAPAATEIAGGGNIDQIEVTAEAAAASAEASAEEFNVADAAAVGASAESGPIDFGAIGRDVIVEMHVVLSSDDLQRSVNAISADASALGGGIASSDVDYGDRVTGALGHAVLVVKLPPEGVARLLDGLDSTATVLSINQSAQDVTEQLVDLDVRIANARQSVTNVRQFMEATTNLNELVTLEAELTRRQTELEQLEAQQRNLSERVALSTITIEILPTAAVPPAPPVPEERGLKNAFSEGWNAFTAILFGIVYVIAVLAPFIVISLIAGALALVIVRHRRRPPAAARPDDDASADDVNEPVAVGSSNRPE